MVIVYSSTGLSSCQERIMEAIKDLGGRASTAEIKEIVVPDSPGMRFSGQMTTVLRNLQKYGIVSCQKVGAENIWSVVK